MLCISGYIGCHSDVMAIVENACSGKQSCDFGVFANLENRDELAPCPAGLKMYLDAAHTCVSGTKFFLIYLLYC